MDFRINFFLKIKISNNNNKNNNLSKSKMNNIYEFIEKNWDNHEVISEKYNNIYKEDLGNSEKGVFYSKGILGFTKDFNKAKEYFNKALLLEPNNQYIIKALGILYFYENNYDKAEEYFLKALEIDPKDINASFSLTITYTWNKSELVEETALKALEIDPNNIKFLQLLGTHYMQVNNFIKSEEYLIRAYSQDIDCEKTLSYLKTLYRRQLRNIDINYINLQVKSIKLENKVEKLENKVDKLEDENKKFKDELEEYALHEAYKPNGIIAERVKEHYEDINKSLIRD